MACKPKSWHLIWWGRGGETGEGGVVGGYHDVSGLNSNKDPVPEVKLVSMFSLHTSLLYKDHVLMGYIGVNLTNFITI